MFDIDGVGDDADLVQRNAARDQIAAQAAANGDNLARLAHGAGFHGAREAVA